MIYIQDQDHLKEVVQEIMKSDRLAVDTEADSLHHYHEKLCLLQISTPKEDYVIDPLVPLDLQDLLKKMESKALIFHGADFDLRILMRFYEFSPKEIFDTMIAAQFLGYKRPSLAALTEQHCGVHLSKSNQKADWSHRPLKDSMLTYASHDTRFLHPIARILEKELEEKKRLTWQKETCKEILNTVSKKPRSDKEKGWRVKGAHALEGRELTILKELWQWREDAAKKRDRPPFKVLNAEVLIQIAKWTAVNRDKPLSSMPKFPKYLSLAMVDTMVKAIDQGFKAPENSVKPPSSKKSSKRLSRREERRLSALKGARQVLTQEFECMPGILASNAVLENLARSKVKTMDEMKSLSCLMRWQLETLGKRFLDVLREIDSTESPPETPAAP